MSVGRYMLEATTPAPIPVIASNLHKLILANGSFGPKRLKALYMKCWALPGICHRDATRTFVIRKIDKCPAMTLPHG